MSFSIHSFMFISWTLIELLGHHSTFLSGMVSMNVVWLHLREIKLLRTKDRSRSSDSNPSNEAFCWNLEVFHGPKTYESTSSSETSFAMNGDGSVIWLLEMWFNNIEEIFNNMVWRSRSINEK